MRRVFYFNILYRCNQFCRFCFSHNTSTGFLGSEISPKVFTECLKHNEVGEFDRVVINGGEPTLHKGLLELIKPAVKTGAETVLYTNGVKLENEVLAKLICESDIDRITVPIHGNSQLHEKITGVSGTYAQTLNGIGNIKNLAKKNLLELKFIVTNDMAASEFSLKDFLEDHSLLDVVGSIVITGQVNTRMAKYNDYQCVQVPGYLHFVERQINDLAKMLPIKLYDFEMCGFREDFLRWFDELRTEEGDTEYRYFFSDEKFPCPKELTYSSMRLTPKCLSCERRTYCRSIVNGYLVTEIYNGHKKLVME